MNLACLFEAARTCLQASDPDAKVQLTLAASADWRQGRLAAGASGAPDPSVDAGRPERPALVHFSRLPKRSLHQAEGRINLVHALTHVEFNAINLAWDAVYRFRGLPLDYYGDWIQVAREEAEHFQLLRDHLRSLDRDYGDLPAHDGLWAMARRADQDPLARMALVPRVLEARGLDVTPGLQERLRAAGDLATLAILEVILRDEIGHVAVGTRWFRFFCQQRELDSEAEFFRLVQLYFPEGVRPPLNLAARRAAGFSDAELLWLEQPGRHREP